MQVAADTALLVAMVGVFCGLVHQTHATSSACAWGRVAALYVIFELLLLHSCILLPLHHFPCAFPFPYLAC